MFGEALYGGELYGGAFTDTEEDNYTQGDDISCSGSNTGTDLLPPDC